MSTMTTLFKITLAILASPIGKKKKEIKGIQIGNKEVTFFADNVVIEVENPRESTNM